MRHHLVLLVLLCIPFIGFAADEKQPKYNWSAVSTTGQNLQVPGTATTVLAFVRPDQPQSRAALDQISRVVGDSADVSIIILVSGERAPQTAGTFADNPGRWPVVVDQDFSASGKFNVHVWPTTVVVNSRGEEVAHLGGIADAFAADLADYLEFATGKIDAAALKARLSEHEVVGQGAGQRVDRHLVAATQFVEGGKLDDARKELLEGLTARPDDPKLCILLARVHLLQDRPAEALEVLEKLPAGSVPPWQHNLLRARALIAMERWDEARGLLPDTLKLNPNPAEAHYLMGLVARNDKNWQQAAEEFRQAYELSRRTP